MSVTGIGEKIASAILSVRESSGNITKPVLNLLTKTTLPAEIAQVVERPLRVR